MARTKTVKRFDFSGCKLLRDEYSGFRDRFKPLELADMAQKHNNDKTPPETRYNSYSYNQMLGIIEEVRQNDKLPDASWRAEYLLQYAFNSDPLYNKERDEQFLAWYDATPDAQELYQYAVKDTSWFYDENGSQIRDVSQIQALKQRPDRLSIFTYHSQGWRADQYRELNRERIYEEGDIILLRTPYIGNYRYDPHYNNAAYTSETPRYGTVVKATGDKIVSGRRGRGSRAISVIWFEKDGGIQTIGEKYIKLESRKGRTARSPSTTVEVSID